MMSSTRFDPETNPRFQKLAWNGALDELDRTRYGTLQVLSSAGDSVAVWDRTDEAQVAEAKALFEEATQSAYVAFEDETMDPARTGTMTTFQKDAPNILFVPMIQGG